MTTLERARLTVRPGLASMAPYGLRVTSNCVSSALRDRDSSGALSENTLDTIDRIANVATYPEQSFVCVEGESPRGVFVLCQGRVKLTTSNRDGKTVIVRIAGPGEMLGLSAVVTGSAHPLTLATVQPSQLGFIARADFLLLMQQHGDACLHVAKQLSDECQSTYNVIRSVGLSVKERLVRLLLRLSVDGHTNGDMIRFDMALTHEEVAQLILTTRETVTRVLGELKRRHVLELVGPTLIIRNMAALDQIVQGNEHGGGKPRQQATL
jgi:CRP/FNR family transcriptional regulator, cyclic AMP receptor protein